MDRLTSVTLRFRCERPGYVANVSVTFRPMPGVKARKEKAPKAKRRPER